ncbi:putative quinol monooxygenase [Sphingomonas sp. Root710]|uniref:putative quinol monooxygenase n=1 Tax=Sphingomonas sp. Root710 TaxID=1736594 RepID=UPI00138F8147|nr:antibiotic biosynthesis monooxygenase family protein [Sphingomonas sp. Root710]
MKMALGMAAALAMAAPAAAAEYDGVVAHILAKPGKRDALIDAMRPLVAMKGCIDLVIAKDSQNEDGIWLTEIWASKQLHEEAAKGEVFTKALVNMRPLMVSIDQNYKTVPVFGTRLK